MLSLQSLMPNRLDSGNNCKVGGNPSIKICQEGAREACQSGGGAAGGPGELREFSWSRFGHGFKEKTRKIFHVLIKYRLSQTKCWIQHRHWMPTGIGQQWRWMGWCWMASNTYTRTKLTPNLTSQVGRKSVDSLQGRYVSTVCLCLLLNRPLRNSDDRLHEVLGRDT